MGMNKLKSIRQGKYFQIEVDDNDQNRLLKKVDEMCKKLFS